MNKANGKKQNKAKLNTNKRTNERTISHNVMLRKHFPLSYFHMAY